MISLANAQDSVKIKQACSKVLLLIIPILFKSLVINYFNYVIIFITVIADFKKEFLKKKSFYCDRRF